MFQFESYLIRKQGNRKLPGTNKNEKNIRWKYGLMTQENEKMTVQKLQLAQGMLQK